jgi:HD-like signal output (HDOD) protein
MAATMNLLGKRLKGYELDSGELWRHSLAVAFGSRAIAGKRYPELANDAFFAGLVHDAGMILLDQPIYEKRRGRHLPVEMTGHGFLNVERQILGVDHAEIGAEVCKHWGLPPSILVTIRYHHDPVDSNGSELAYVVHMADLVSNFIHRRSVESEGVPQFPEEILVFLGLEGGELLGIMEEVMRSVEGIVKEVQR